VYANNTGFKHKQYNTHLSWHDTKYWEKDRLRNWDVVVGCESADSIIDTPKAKLRVLHLQLNHPIIQKEQLDKINLAVGVSRWHVGAISDFNPYLLKWGGLLTDIPEGTNPKYSEAAKSIAKIPNKVIYASSPDRGAHHFKEIWPLVTQEIPEAELHLCYGAYDWAQSARWAMNEASLRAVQIASLYSDPTITFHKPMDKWALARELQSSSLMVYPCDTIALSEGYCITILLANASGTPVITTDCDALGEVHSHYTAMLQLPVNARQFANTIIELLTDNSVWTKYSDAGLARESSWEHIAPKWIELFNEGLSHECTQGDINS